MTPEYVLKTLRSGSPEERKRFVENCPESPFKESVLPLVASDHPGMVVVAMTQLTITYCNGLNPEVGATLAFATHAFAVELFESGADANLLPTTMSNLACQHTNALNLLGRSPEVLTFTDQYIPYYEKIGESENLPTLKTARVNALLNLNRIDEAENMLRDPKLRGSWSNDIEVNRLEKKLQQLKARITETKTEAEKKQHTGTPDGADLIDILKTTISHAIDDPEQKEELLEAADKLDPTNRIDPNTPEGFRQLTDLLRMGEKFITEDSTEESEWTIKRKVREASGLFVMETKPSPEKIKNSLADLQECLAWAKTSNHTELQNDALWGIYLCYSRLDQPSAAADALLQMRANHEAIRRGIEDPLERGGVFSTYPHLFDALCEKLQESGRTEDLLETIEASKGRGIADILTQKSGSVVPDADVYAAVKSLPELTRKHRFHYLTYYVDIEQTYIVLVSKDGNIHTVEPVPISKSTIRDASENVDPRSWGTPAEYDPSIVIENVSELLSPLVQCLQALLEKGVVAAGDHLCYSSDDNFHNIPLQYLQFNGKYLVDTFSVSKIQNAFHLHKVLSAPASLPPAAFAAVLVPTQQNLQKPNWLEMQKSFRQPAKLLQKLMADGETLEQKSGSVDQLMKLDLTQRVVHFSTHGIFPRNDESQNPFEQSGLVLSAGNALPDENAVGLGKNDFLLSPDKILNQKLDFTNSHISMMACVSGLSREGIGGDALGMEWAFIQAGAASLLSSHWYVSAKLAAGFFERFYHHWLSEKKSRARAYVDTITDLRAKGDIYGHPLYWAAFSLTGNWR